MRGAFKVDTISSYESQVKNSIFQVFNGVETEVEAMAFANIAAVERLQTKLIDGLDLDDKPSLQEAFQYRAALDVVLSIAKKALIQKLSSEGGLQDAT